MKLNPPTNPQNNPVSDIEAFMSQWGPLAFDAEAFAAHRGSFAADEAGVLYRDPWTAEIQGGPLEGPFLFENRGFTDPDCIAGHYVTVTSARGQTVNRGVRTAIIPIVGPITPFALPEWMERYGIRAASLPKIVGAARAAANDPDVGRIVLAIHSPGGTVYGVPEAFAALREVGKRKKLVASINYMGASAAYWLASAASEIVATPSALVGSIGAAIRHVSLAGAYEQFGVAVTDIARPESKRDVSEAKPLSDTGRAEITRLVEAAYEDFKSDISLSRRLDFDNNGQQYGRIVPASDALGLKLIDRVVTFDTVLAEGPAVDLPTLTRRATLALLKRKNPDA